MRTVYAVAFSGGKYLMVYNPARKGWEMPGGKMESGEDIAAATKREFLEESGYVIEIVAVRNLGYCDVCAAILHEKTSDGEMESRLFSELPTDLSFSKEEYEDVIPWAKAALTERNI